MNGLPDFIHIGPNKSASTWLYHVLKTHPEVKLPTKKEIRYFPPGRGHKRNSIEWYNKYFENTEGYITGDLTPSYILGEDTPQQIIENVPWVKTFCVVRNPVERAFSNWRMVRCFKRVDLSRSFLECFLTNSNNIKSFGLYFTHISRYLKSFELDKNFKIFVYDDLIESPVKFLSSVCEYIGIKSFDCPLLHKRWKNRYSNDGLKITKKDALVVFNYYYHEIQLLENLINRKLNWGKLFKIF